ncbi:MAG TPA: YoaK family protein [Thermomicrobiales bacterium]|nr:YoaK family protein [Thermomicrobiales bacterium]
MALRDTLVVLLAAVSGYVDVVSYLGLGRVFTSNMTGNTILLGLALGQERGLAALRSGVALAGFLAGVAVAAAIVRRADDREVWPPAVTVACAVECAVLLAFAAWGARVGAVADRWPVYPLIALSAVAMGIQSTAVRALGVSGVTTTFITGTWTSLISGVVRRFRPADGTRREDRQAGEGARLQAAVVGVYFVAAVAGGAAEGRWLLAAVALPAAAVALVTAAAALRFRRDA